MNRPVRLREIVPFKKRRRRQDHVRVERCVVHHLFEDDREEIVPLQAGDDAALIGNGRDGIAVVDEEDVDRRIRVLGQRAPEMVHVDEPRVGLARGNPRAIDVPRRGVAHRVAAAAHAELAADGRQRQHRHRRIAAVAIAFESPAAADERRRAFGVQASNVFDGRGLDAGHVRRPRHRPGLGAFAQLVGADRVFAQKRFVGMAVHKEVAMNRERDGDVGSRLHGEMDVGRPRELRRPRVDHDELRAARSRVVDVRHEVNPGRRGIDAPEDDEFRLRIILVGDGGHLPVERHVGRARRRRAHGAREPRRSEPAPQLRQQPVRSAV